MRFEGFALLRILSVRYHTISHVTRNIQHFQTLGLATRWRYIQKLVRFKKKWHISICNFRSIKNKKQIDQRWYISRWHSDVYPALCRGCCFCVHRIFLYTFMYTCSCVSIELASFRYTSASLALHGSFSPFRALLQTCCQTQERL